MAVESTNTAVLESIRSRFSHLKKKGDRTLGQLNETDLLWKANEETNSIAVIVQHMRGNMLSRWTNFLTEDGEKQNRDRDSEFIEPESMTQAESLRLWNEGWSCLEDTLESLPPEDLFRTITIRGNSLTALDSLHLHMTEYAYHVGQLVQLAKERLGTRWETLSTPRGQSKPNRPLDRD